MEPRSWRLLSLMCSSSESSDAMSVHVAGVTALGEEVGEPGPGVVGGMAAVRHGDVDERGMDVPGHVVGVAADVQVRAFLQPGVELPALLAQAVLHVDLLRGVAREGEVEAVQPAALQGVLPLDLVEEVAGEVAV